MTSGLIRVGRTFFALALVGLGIEHFVFGDFVTGRAPAWPEAFPGRALFAGLTGILIVGAAALFLLGKRTRDAAIVVAVLVGSWALLRHIPVVIAAPVLSGAWTRAGKALVLFGGALAIGFATRRMSGLGRWSLGLFLLISGIQHFVHAKFVVSLIPTWFPGHAAFWTYFAGVALICGGVGLFIPRTAGLAALLSGLMVFSWFWIVHIPRIPVGMSDQIAVFEALAVCGIAFVLSGQARDATAHAGSSPRRS